MAFGYLSGAYNWSYAACQLPIGVILDKFGVKRVGRISTFLWSIASFLAAITPNLGGFFAARLLLGVGEAPTFPANAKAIGLWFPSSERSFATSIFDSAAKFAPAVGIPLIGMLLIRVGWRWSFAATGIISLLYFVLFYCIYRDPQDDPALTDTERNHIQAEYLQPHPPSQTHPQAQPAAPAPAPVESASLGYLFRQRKVIGLALGFGSYNYVFYLLLTWLPSYLAAELHIDLLHSFLYTAAPWLFATVTDLFIGGLLVDALIHRGWNPSHVRRTVLIAGTAFGLGIFGTAHVHTATAALIWISISIGGLAAAAPVGWSIPSLVAPRGSVGTLGGILNFSNQLSGIAAPIITGYVVAARNSYAWAFYIAAAYLLIGIAGYIFLLGKIEPIPPQPQP